jgi:elongation factor P
LARLLAAASQPFDQASAFLRLSFLLTAAGQPRILTGFPFQRLWRTGSLISISRPERFAKIEGQTPMIQATQLRPGMIIEFNGELYSIFRTEHRTPGNLRGFVQARMRNLRTGAMVDHRFASTDFVERAFLEEQEVEYLYEDGGTYYFMNTEDFSQIALTEEQLGDAVNYLVPQLRLKVEFYEGKPIGVSLPPTVDLTVVETEPGLRGATVSNVTKPAKLETGLVVQVPPFINEGDRIRVNTEEGTYLERA